MELGFDYDKCWNRIVDARLMISMLISADVFCAFRSLRTRREAHSSCIACPLWTRRAPETPGDSRARQLRVHTLAGIAFGADPRA